MYTLRKALFVCRKKGVSNVSNPQILPAPQADKAFYRAAKKMEVQP
jgi:hypothetical protein